MNLVPYKAIANIDREKKAEKRSAFRPLVYICSPFSGDIEGNKKNFRVPVIPMYTVNHK